MTDRTEFEKALEALLNVIENARYPREQIDNLVAAHEKALAEQIHAACPCPRNQRSCCCPNCACYAAVPHTGNLLVYEPETCRWPGHALADKVAEMERQTVAIAFARRELSRIASLERRLQEAEKRADEPL